jgi:hypothetical protein
MNRKINSTDPDILGSLPAMRRAAKRAWKLAKSTGTPFYVLKDGRVTDLNPGSKPNRRRRTQNP